MERITDYNKVQPIIEAYVCIQTEGSRAGRPHFLVRTTGCTHRCFFGEGGWCDSWYTSIEPEKGTWNLQAIKDLFIANPQINHLMISGGSPTMHPKLVNELVIMFKEIHCDEETRNHVKEGNLPSYMLAKGYVTIETEGSHFIETAYPIDLISLSPKFKNSTPILGTPTPSGKLTEASMIKQHEKFRMNHDAISKMLAYHLDYHFKPVVDRNDTSVWEEIDAFRIQHNIPKDKIWVMPAGDTLDKLQPNYAYVMEECIKRGYNFTGRAHIVAYNDLRGV